MSGVVILQIIGAVGVGVALLLYAFIYAEHQGWTNPMPSAAFRRAMLRDTHAILLISLVLLAGALF